MPERQAVFCCCHFARLRRRHKLRGTADLLLWRFTSGRFLQSNYAVETFAALSHYRDLF